MRVATGVRKADGQVVGAPRRNAGESSPLARCETLRVSIRRTQLADLIRVAEGWGVSVSTCAWLVLTERMDCWRKRGRAIGATREREVEVGAALDLLRISKSEWLSLMARREEARALTEGSGDAG